jgi:hypothetical protein
MDLFPYLARLQRDLRTAAEPGGEATLAVAERLAAGLEASTRLVLLDALVEAAGEISGDLGTGSVEVRLRGRDVEFVVSPAARIPTPAAGTPYQDADPVEDAEDGGAEGGTARLSLRLPERLKAKVERAAEGAGLSVNAWLVRSIGALVETRPWPSAPRAGGTTSQRRTGWVR